MTRLLASIPLACIALALLGGPLPADPDWDADGDGALGEEEFAEGFGRTGIFEDWDDDGDGLVSKREFSDSLHERYDLDGDGRIEDRELEALDDDMRKGGPWDF